jgi:ubiquinone/menaquinone biosynthesis C-methylase UbiE
MANAPAPADIYDPAFVRDLFDRCSGKYIAFSYVCSMGFTERWRRQCVDHLSLPAQRPLQGYDLMAGTGEVWPHLLKAAPNITAITAVDISAGMHKRALARVDQHSAHRINFIEDDALNSALPDKSADFLVSTFGLKTFNAAQHKQLAALIARVLKPGGTFALIEASDPKGWALRPLYLFHLKQVLPLIERVFLNGAQDFSMIGQYSTRFGDARQFTEYLRSEGLDASFKSRFFGCASVAFGTKPERV